MSTVVASSFAALQKIVTEGQAVRVRFPDQKKSVLVDVFTASAIVGMYGNAKEEHKAKIEAFVAKSFYGFERMRAIAMGG